MKNYKKILEGVVNIIKTTEKTDIGFANICSYLSDNCDELFESEDERIRKEIISALKFANHKSVYDKHIAWLEKQKPVVDITRMSNGILEGAALNLITWIDSHLAEGNMCLSNIECDNIVKAMINGDWDKIYGYLKKKTEKQGHNEISRNSKKFSNVEPKFKVGDWITSNCTSNCNSSELLHIIDLDTKDYEVETPQGNTGVPSITYIDNNYHLWSIEDAKDGDVLYSPEHNLLWIYKNKEECYVAVNLNYANSTSFGTNIAIPSDVFPATKEQRNLLFSKMHEVGYEWDSQKKELKEVIIKPKFKVGDWIVKKNIVQKNIGVYKVIEICNLWYEVIDSKDNHYKISYDKECMCRLWSIEDANDGDVLISQYNKPFIYNGNREQFFIGTYCGISTADRFIVTTEKCSWTKNENIHPATKEQRDTLFTKIREAGYEWDRDKKKLIKNK